MDIRNKSAENLVREGQYDDAFNVYREIFDTQVSTLGFRHIETLRTLSKIASIYVKKMMYDDALRIYNDIFQVRISLLGNRHRETIEAGCCIMDLLEKQGKPEEALRLYIFVENIFQEQILEIRESYYRGKLDKALQSGFKVYEDASDLLGRYEKITLKARKLIGNIYSAMGKYNEALYVYDEVYRKRLDLFGRDHPKTLSSLMNRAYILLKKCDFSYAKSTFNSVYQKRKQILGPYHLNTLRSHKGVAYALSEQGAFDEASEILLKILDTLSIQQNDKEILLVKKDLADVDFKQKNYEDALNLYSEIYSNEIRIAPNNPAALVTRHKIAHVLVLQGNYIEAERLFQEILDVQKSMDVNENTLDIERELATILMLKGQLDAAEQIFRRLAKDSDEILGPKHTVTLSIQSRLGFLLCKQKYYNEALNVFVKVRNISEECFGLYHPETLSAKNNIALLYFLQGKYTEALTLYQEIKEIRSAIFFPNHPDCLSIDTSIAGVYVIQRKYDKAFKIFCDLYKRKADIYGEDHEYALEMKEEIFSVRDEMPEPRLITAAKEGNFNQVLCYLEDGDDVNVQDKYGNTALHMAAEGGFQRIMELLLQNKAMFSIENFENKTPEDFCSNHGSDFYLAMLRYLFYLEFRREETKACLEDERIIVNATDDFGRTLLHIAASKGCVDVVRKLLHRGADQKAVSTEGDTALHTAVKNSHYNIIRALLNHLGSGTQAYEYCINAKNTRTGETALHLAAIRNDKFCIRLLLDYSANPKIENKLGKLPVELTRDHDIFKDLCVAFLRFT